MVNQELSVIQQTSNALNQCCHGTSAFAGSSEAVECHRLLLVACKSYHRLLSLKTTCLHQFHGRCPDEPGLIVISAESIRENAGCTSSFFIAN